MLWAGAGERGLKWREVQKIDRCVTVEVGCGAIVGVARVDRAETIRERGGVLQVDIEIRVMIAGKRNAIREEEYDVGGG